MTLLHLKVLRDRKIKANLPEAANGRVKALRRLCKWAIGENLLPTNPALGLSKVKGHADKGFKLWTPKDIEAFEERHPICTKARLAFDIFRYLGCARVDAVKVGWPMVESVGGKRIVHFNRSKTDVEASPLFTDGLVATINATPKVGIRTWACDRMRQALQPRRVRQLV
ncbi:MAG TPA: hypothetical protein VFZ16_05180 [Hyphomicrobiaceae bacterium]|nr:hypothetical protein [Hyphomicrobiaceae bacterium]